MNISTLQEYIQKIKDLNRNKDQDKGYAPYKPFLLLAVVELIKQRKIEENEIILSDDLIALFKKYVSLTPEWNENRINYAFLYLNNDGFWHLYPIELRNARPEPSVSEFRDADAYVNLDDALFDLLRVPEHLEAIRQTIINTYFPNLRQKIEDLTIEEDAEKYSESLIKSAEDPFLPFSDVESIQVETPIRSSGFRRAIMKIYDYKCAVCELNTRAANGESITDAAHIIPFHVSYNDNVQNGISLCKSHHWAFDAKLFSLSKTYQVIVAPFALKHESTGWIRELRDTSIWLPKETKYRPAQYALTWHRERVMNQ